MAAVQKSKDAGRYRPSRHYFLLRVANFVNFKDPDLFSPHMDLMFLRKVYDEFQTALEQNPNFAFQQRSDANQIPSTPYVVASRPERAARDLARNILVAANAKYEIRIEGREPAYFLLRYKRSWKQQSFSPQIRIRRDQLRFTGVEYADNIHTYKKVEIAMFAQETVFVQFFRLEPSFQMYEYAAVIEALGAERPLRLPGWNADDDHYVPFEHKILVKSMFRPFLVTQGRTTFIQNANSMRDAFSKATTKLKNNQVQIEISDTFDKNRYVNNAGTVLFKFNKKAPVIQQFKRRADSKRSRTHCIEKTYLFEKGAMQHVIHTSLVDEDVFKRDLERNLKNAISKFLRMIRTDRLNARQKESSTFAMLKNRWFLIACACLSDNPDVNNLLQHAFDALHARNPSMPQTLEYATLRQHVHESLFDLLMGLLDEFDPEEDEVPYEEFTSEIDREDLVNVLEERNLPIPPSKGCDGAAGVQTVRGNVMNVTEGHEPFPRDLLEGFESHSFGEWTTHQTTYTRDFILDTYVKNIRDDLKRINKRNNNAFIQYLTSISFSMDEEDPAHVEFGKPKKERLTLYQRIIRAIFN